jgi:hypothetical protein
METPREKMETEASGDTAAARGALERLKALLAALVLGAVLYSAVVAGMLNGAAELGALTAYGVTAFGVVAWRARRLARNAG